MEISLLLTAKFQSMGLWRRDENLRGGTKLVGDKMQGRLRNDLTRSQQTTRIAQRTQLQREAELVMITAAPADDGQIVVAEGPVPDKVGFGHG